MRQQKYFNNNQIQRHQRLANRRDADLLIRAANKANVILTLMVLADKFDFTTEDLEKFLAEYRSQLDAYNTGHVTSVSDFEQVLWEEHGMRIDL